MDDLEMSTAEQSSARQAASSGSSGDDDEGRSSLLAEAATARTHPLLQKSLSEYIFSPKGSVRGRRWHKSRSTNNTEQRECCPSCLPDLPHWKTWWCCVSRMQIGVSVLALGTVLIAAVVLFLHRIGFCFEPADGPHLVFPIGANSTISRAPPGAPPLLGTYIAFVGDTDLTGETKKLYSLISAENPTALVHLGDVDYHNDPNAWMQLVNQHLASQLIILPAFGNHDECRWQDYQEKARDRLLQQGQIGSCEGVVGELQVCVHRNVVVLSMAPAIKDADHHDYPSYIRQQLDRFPNATFRVCAWHKNMHLMQTGEKKDTVGWDVYEACREKGAIIMTGHEHAYSRSFVMSDISNQVVIPPAAVATGQLSVMEVDYNQTFVVVSGLGGRNVRPLKATGPWWAALSNAGTGGTAGALFCLFHDSPGAPRNATCHYKNTNGQTVDSFRIRSMV